MYAMVCTAPFTLEWQPLHLPPLGPRDVLIHLSQTGICPSDVRVYVGKSSSTKLPKILGHETVGQVVEVGREVVSVKPGQWVVPDGIIKCGCCAACRKARSNKCQRVRYASGAYGQAMIVPETNVYPLHETTPLPAATFTEPLACVLRGERMLRITPGETALIVGCGPIGLLHLQVAKRFGARVLVADLKRDRLDKALSLGADVALDPQRPLREAVLAETDGYGADVAVVAFGSARLVESAAEALAYGGRLNIFAGVHPKDSLSIDPNLIHYNELVITGSADHTPLDYAEALNLIERGLVQVLPLISDVIPLRDLQRGFEIVQAQQGLKVIVEVNPDLVR
ncbi:MAG: alcohol dehydrogenase catalytic domain-containing protein [Anaerolineae bacterium]|nr:alcohol dehydrogenase catalytic domain-containing protein [Thermoflexales bacterium]MDW8408031.1 alcohol dehydrogenase catalytic domain-containing protein [Anaerolineae bacterium]